MGVQHELSDTSALRPPRDSLPLTQHTRCVVLRYRFRHRYRYRCRYCHRCRYRDLSPNQRSEMNLSARVGVDRLGRAGGNNIGSAPSSVSPATPRLAEDWLASSSKSTGSGGGGSSSRFEDQSRRPVFSLFRFCEQLSSLASKFVGLTKASSPLSRSSCVGEEPRKLASPRFSRCRNERN